MRENCVISPTVRGQVMESVLASDDINRTGLMEQAVCICQPVDICYSLDLRPAWIIL